MVYMRAVDILATGDDPLDIGVNDLALQTLENGDVIVHTTTGSNGGLASYRLSADGSVEHVDSVHFPDHASPIVNGAITMMENGGTPKLVFGGDGETDLTGYELSENGEYGDLIHTGDICDDASTVSAMTESATTGALYLTDDDADTIRIYTSDGTGGYTNGATLEDAGQIVTMTTLTIDGEEILLAANGETNGVDRYRIDPETGELSEHAHLGAGDGIGVNAPTDMLALEAHDEGWVILASAGSSSLSVMRVGEDGGLEATEHLLDSRDTRFSDVQAIDTVTVDDHVFLVAGGGNDGLSLFTLLPDGRLMHLQSLPDGPDTGLDNINTIAATEVGGTLQILVGAQGDSGVTRLEIDIDSLGDVIRGGPGTEELVGTSGDDMIVAGDGNDVLRGGGGDNIFVGGTGANVFHSGSGADTFVLHGESAPDTIIGFRPDRDTIDLTDFAMLRNIDQLEVTPTDHGARVTYFASEINITSHDGSSLTAQDIFGDRLEGPDRALPDRIPIDGEIIRGDENDNELIGSEGDDLIIAGGGNNLIHGVGGNNIIRGGDGNDEIYGGTGENVIDGGGGNNKIWAGPGDDRITAGDGNNIIGGGAGNARIEVGDGDNLIYGGSPGDNTIIVGDGDNRVWGGNGETSITAGDGDNRLGGGRGDATITAGDGDNRIFGGPSGFNTITVGDGNNEIWAGQGVGSVITAGDGNNRIGGGAGDAEITVGEGNNVIYGGRGDNSITAGDGDNVLWGGAGDSTIIAGDGDNRIGGNVGDNTLEAGDGNNRIWGGTGDSIIVAGDGDNVVGGGEGDNSITLGHGDNIVWGNTGDSVIRTGNGNNDIRGGIGNNEIYTGNGNDVIRGMKGNDIIHSTGGDNRIYGGDGDNIIWAGSGDDVVTGNAGADTFIFKQGDDTLRITDYTIGEDMLHLEEDIWGGGLTAEELIAEHAEVRDGDTVFTFDDHVITLSGVGDLGGLADDLVLL